MSSAEETIAMEVPVVAGVKPEEARRVLSILALPTDEYAVCGGALLAEHGLRINENDVDLLVTMGLYSRIDPQWLKHQHGSDAGIKTPYVEIDGVKIEAFPSIDFVDYEKAQVFIDRAELRNGIRFVRLNDMLEWKRLILETRPKNKKNPVHIADIALIEKHLKGELPQ